MTSRKLWLQYIGPTPCINAVLIFWYTFLLFSKIERLISWIVLNRFHISGKLFCQCFGLGDQHRITKDAYATLTSSIWLDVSITDLFHWCLWCLLKTKSYFWLRGGGGLKKQFLISLSCCQNPVRTNYFHRCKRNA